MFNMTDPNTQIDARLAILLEWLEENDESGIEPKEDSNYDIPDINIEGGNYD